MSIYKHLYLEASGIQFPSLECRGLIGYSGGVEFLFLQKHSTACCSSRSIVSILAYRQFIINSYLQMEDDDYEMFKIVVIGSSGIGKSNIALRFAKGQYKDTTKTTIGVEFLHKILTINGTKVKVTLWDTAGQEVYRSLSKVYYKGALGVILVYDVTSQSSYLEVEEWYKLANDSINVKDAVLMLLGNKIDLVDQKVVPFEAALKDYKEKLGIQCFQVSALSGEGIQESIMYMIERIYDKHVRKDEPPPSDPEEDPKADPLERSTANKNTYIRGSVRSKPPKQQEQTEMQQSSQMKLEASRIRGSRLEQSIMPKPRKKCAC